MKLIKSIHIKFNGNLNDFLDSLMTVIIDSQTNPKQFVKFVDNEIPQDYQIDIYEVVD